MAFLRMPFFAEMGFGMTETYMAKDDGIRSFINHYLTD